MAAMVSAAGQDHMGQDHMGQDHMGQDHMGQDHMGQDHMGQDHMGQDHMGQYQLASCVHVHVCLPQLAFTACIWTDLSDVQSVAGPVSHL